MLLQRTAQRIAERMSISKESSKRTRFWRRRTSSSRRSYSLLCASCPLWRIRKGMTSLKMFVLYRCLSTKWLSHKWAGQIGFLAKCRSNLKYDGLVKSEMGARREHFENNFQIWVTNYLNLVSDEFEVARQGTAGRKESQRSRIVSHRCAEEIDLFSMRSLLWEFYFS